MSVIKTPKSKDNERWWLRVPWSLRRRPGGRNTYHGRTKQTGTDVTKSSILQELVFFFNKTQIAYRWLHWTVRWCLKRERKKIFKKHTVYCPSSLFQNDRNRTVEGGSRNRINRTVASVLETRKNCLNCIQQTQTQTRIDRPTHFGVAAYGSIQNQKKDCKSTSPEAVKVQ